MVLSHKLWDSSIQPMLRYLECKSLGERDMSFLFFTNSVCPIFHQVFSSSKSNLQNNLSNLQRYLFILCIAAQTPDISENPN